MIVEIDDAGTGSPVGGIVIGCRKGDTFVYRVIPPEFFSDNGVFSDATKQKVLDMVIELLKEVNFNPKEDEIVICSSELFSKVRDFLARSGYNWKVGRIRERTQDLVEAAFDYHLVRIGVPRMLVKRLLEYKDYPVVLMKWVALDLERRSILVKRIFPYWKKVWSQVKIKFESTLCRRRKYCIACGEKIEKGEKIVIIKYITPKRIYIGYAHKGCINRGEDQ